MKQELTGVLRFVVRGAIVLLMFVALILIQELLL